MNNNEKFNAVINSCHDPRAVMSALLTLADAGFFQREQKEAGAA